MLTKEAAVRPAKFRAGDRVGITLDGKFLDYHW